ncbi:unnamed protein product [Auanema sp. JU1783]|nr:unnamed protein product [Auanema sp. JU1783]
MKLLIIISIIIIGCSSLTCYNGMKMLSMQAVGESSEECQDSGASCYNMTASAMLLVDVVKAGCSTWRCMLAKNRCISTYFQMVPVSLCCCDSDRCNVAGNPTGAFNNFGSTDPNSNFQNNYPQNNAVKETNEAQKSNWGTSWTAPASAGSSTKQWTKQEVEDKFKNFDVDQRPTSATGDAVEIEEVFVKKDALSTSPPRAASSSTGNRAERLQTSNNNNGKDEISIP